MGSRVSESAVRQEVISAIFLIILAVYLPFSFVATLLLLLGVFSVWVVELLNSAIETAVDMVSAAFLMALLNAVVVWSVVFYQYYRKDLSLSAVDSDPKFTDLQRGSFEKTDQTID